MKRNVILMAALLLTSVAMTSCFKDKPDTSQEGLYVGIIGFNDELHTKTLKILNDQTKDEMKEYIDNLSMSNGTILYHAVNTALDKIESITPPADLINVSVITFTDGLDQGSYVLNDNYNSNDDYLNAVSNRIKSTYISDIPVSAYTIGVKGSDVVDINSFRRNLEKLSSNEENVYEVESMSQVGTIFADIAQDLYNQSSSYDVTLKLPAQIPAPSSASLSTTLKTPPNQPCTSKAPTLVKTTKVCSTRSLMWVFKTAALSSTPLLLASSTSSLSSTC